MSLGSEIVGAVGILALLAIIVLWRIFRRDTDNWRRIRVGVFVERDTDQENEK